MTRRSRDGREPAAQDRPDRSRMTLRELEVLESVDRRLHDVLANGGGLPGLIDAGSNIIGAPLALLTPLRRIVAASGFDSEADPSELVSVPGSSQVPIEIDSRVWGLLCSPPAPRATRPEHAAVMSRLPPIIAIEVLRFSEVMPADERTLREFVIDLLVGTVRSSQEFLLRAAFVGFSPRSDGHLVGMAMPRDSVPGSDVGESLETAGVAHICAPLNQDLLLLIELTDPGDVDWMADLIVATVPHSDHATGPILAAGPVTADHGRAGWTLNEARDTLTIARDLQMRDNVVKAESVAIERLFSRLVNDDDLDAFVDETLWKLRAHDQTHRSPLVPTLEALLRTGLNRAAAGRALGIRRQTVHARVQTIEKLVGPLGDPERRIALELALRIRPLALGGTRIATSDGRHSGHSDPRLGALAELHQGVIASPLTLRTAG